MYKCCGGSECGPAEKKNYIVECIYLLLFYLTVFKSTKLYMLGTLLFKSLFF